MEEKIEGRHKEEAAKKFEDTVMEDFVTKAGGKATQRNKRKEFKNPEYSFEATFQNNPALLKYCTKKTVINNCDSD